MILYNSFKWETKGTVTALGGGIHRDLFGQIVSLENLFAAWHEFRRGKKKKRDIQEFEFALEDNLFTLREELLSRTYRHLPYKSFYVQDPKLRHIHKATVRDRVLHQAIFRVLYPIFDKRFIFDSYSCRVDKGTHSAVLRLEQFARKVSGNWTRPVFALKCDVRKFFDSIDQDILLRLIERWVDDGDTLRLIKIVIESFSKNEGVGLPLGNVTSQLFANIYLNELDQFMKNKMKAKHYLRYCDDFIILAERDEGFSEMVATIGTFLRDRLHLALHEKKIIVRKSNQGVDFLGYIVFPHYRLVRAKTRRRMFRKFNAQTAMYRAGAISDGALAVSLRSYLGVLSHADAYRLAEKMRGLVRFE